jgi:hypothetical protein
VVPVVPVVTLGVGVTVVVVVAVLFVPVFVPVFVSVVEHPAKTSVEIKHILIIIANFLFMILLLYNLILHG